MGYCSGVEDGDDACRHSIDATISYDIIPLNLSLKRPPMDSNGNWITTLKQWSNYSNEEYKYVVGDLDHDRLTSYSEFDIYESNCSNSITNYFLDGNNVLLKRNLFDPSANDDLDNDGLKNENEFKYYNYGANPFVKDIFIEVDWMEKTDQVIKYRTVKEPNGGQYNEKYYETELISHHMKEISQIQLIKQFIKNNISLHIDDGSMGEGSGVNYTEKITYNIVIEKYRGESQKWNKSFNKDRINAFHYCLFANKIEGNNILYPTNGESRKGYTFVVYDGSGGVFSQAHCFMHELGHNLGLPDIDNLFGDYDTCMNRRNLNEWMVDYSKEEWKMIDIKGCF